VSAKHEFNENRLIDSPSLFISVNDFVPHFPYFSIDSDEIRNKRFSLNAVEHLRVPWKLVL
jgi:hypothetical protein